MLEVAVLVRHARPLVDPRVPRSNWPLTAAGTEAARATADAVSGRVGEWPLLCSTEQKSIETAAQLAPAGISPLVLSGLAEVEHPWYERHEEHQGLALEYIGGRDIEGWEPAGDAVRRFSEALASADSPHVVAVTHGIVMALWTGAVVDGLDARTFWQKLSMPDAWLVDIARSTIERLL